MAFYNQQPFLSPKIPFTGSIQGGLQEGKAITVTGRVLPGAERFHVNLQCGSRKNPRADIAFHFNPRYEGFQDYVVCNTLQNQSWGAEERKYEMPLARGTPFTLMIMVNRDTYMVAVNGSHFLDFKHRISISSVDTISVEGGVEVNSIAFQNPMPQFAAQPSFPVSSAFAMPAYGMPPPAYTPPQTYAVPYKTFIPGGLCPGRIITIQGRVRPQASRFHINLRFQYGIAFHFNPRFGENTVVRNTQLQEKWGQEERGGSMPFIPGHNFLVVIMCDSQCYSVAVNSSQVFTYRHRVSELQKIDILEVDGDVDLTSVTF
ncbi:galectin-9-like isoform X2 [Lepisosteus oculatus]|uniref:galectin-9-like isoform X2 n=1 Tax=Lepisosteus oculatus TaxID=7918 RepID=UPI003718950E